MGYRRTALLADLCRVYAMAERDDTRLAKMETSELRAEARRLGLWRRPRRGKLSRRDRLEKTMRWQENRAKRESHTLGGLLKRVVGA